MRLDNGKRPLSSPKLPDKGFSLPIYSLLRRHTCLPMKLRVLFKDFYDDVRRVTNNCSTAGRARRTSPSCRCLATVWTRSILNPIFLKLRSSWDTTYIIAFYLHDGLQHRALTSLARRFVGGALDCAASVWAWLNVRSTMSSFELRPQVQNNSKAV